MPFAVGFTVDEIHQALSCLKYFNFNVQTRISIRHVGIYVQFKAQQTERLYRSRHDKVQLKLLF